MLASLYIRRKAISLRAGAAIGALLLGLALSPTAAFAQTPTSAESASEQEIVVTGTRIRRPDFTASNPVVSVGADTIESAGATNITDLLQDLPALVGSSTSNDNAGSNAGIGTTGLNLLNLRNLGTQRTLVLVNGRRHVASDPGSASVDTNTIPVELIDRIDVLTGGASAIYGADGVSGVVNFVTRTDFEGLALRAQVGAPEKDGAENQFISLAAGQNFLDNTLNISGSVEYNKDNRLDFGQRFPRGTFARLARDPSPGPNGFTRIPTVGTRFFDSSRSGAVDVDLDFNPDFNGNGTVWDPGTFVPPFFQVGGSGTLQDDYSNDLLPENERTAANLFINWELNPALTVFSELKYVRTESFSLSQPSFDFFLQFELDNPFIPANVLNAANAAGSPFILSSRDNFDLGQRGEDVRRETTRGVFGLKGEVGDLFDWEASYTYGETDVRNRILNNRFQDRFFYALDVVRAPNGQIVCRSTLNPAAVPQQIAANVPTPGTFTPGANSGCVPLNLFGEGVLNSAARDWVMQTSISNATLKQQVAQAFATGDFDFLFQLPAGSVDWVLGAEYRKEESEAIPPIEDQRGLTFGNQLDITRGEFDVSEAFAELSVPLLKDLPFAQNLSMDAAYRYSDYSTVGKTDTWKVGLNWAPIEDIRFRATRAQAVRAPNISELFEPGSQTFDFITDPCDIANVNSGTSFRAGNCATLLNGFGVNPATYVDPNSASVSGLIRGNTGLQEETAETDTLGVVLTPSFIPGLQLSIDYYTIELTDAINAATAQEIADQCVDLPTLTNQFCALLTRTAVNGGGITNFIQQPVNVAKFNTSGYDFSINYRIDPADWGIQEDIGLFNLRLIGNKLEDLTFINLPGATPDEDLGEQFVPEWQVNLDLTWTGGPWSVNYGFNYFSETDRFTREEVTGDPRIAAPQFLKFSERATHDIQVRVETPMGVEPYFGINNFTNEKPDLGVTFYPVPATGRFFYVGLRASTDQIGNLFR